MAGIVFCRNCQYPLTVNEQFCGNCGTFVNPAATQPAITPTLCTQCGSPLVPGNTFCSNCGASSLLEDVIPTVPARKRETLPPTVVDPLAPTIADAIVIDIPLRSEDLEPDFANLRNNRWYSRDLKGLQVHIDNHDFCTKVREIAAKTAHDIETDEAISRHMRDNLLRQIKKISDSFPLLLPLYWTNLSELLAKVLIEIATSFEFEGKRAGTEIAGIAVMSAERIFEHARYRLTYFLISAFFPNSAEKFGFPDIAAYMRKYEEYCYESSPHIGEQRALAEIYTGERYKSKPDCFIGATLVGRDDRRVRNQRLYLSHSWGISREDLLIFPKVHQVIDRASWHVYYLPQILVSILASATFSDGEAIQELNYEPGLNMDDYKEICSWEIPFSRKGY